MPRSECGKHAESNVTVKSCNLNREHAIRHDTIRYDATRCGYTNMLRDAENAHRPIDYQKEKREILAVSA